MKVFRAIARGSPRRAGGSGGAGVLLLLRYTSGVEDMDQKEDESEKEIPGHCVGEEGRQWQAKSLDLYSRFATQKIPKYLVTVLGFYNP